MSRTIHHVAVMRFAAVLLAVSVHPTAREARAQAMPLAVPRPVAPTENAKACKCVSDGPTVFVYLDGSIKGTDKKNSESSTTNGALGVGVTDAYWDATLMINVAASSDSITRGYGQTLLVPGNGGFASGLIDVRRSLVSLNLPSLYIRGYLSSSSHRWSVYDNAGATSAAVANALGSGLGLSWQIFAGTLKRTVAGSEGKQQASGEAATADGVPVNARGEQGDGKAPGVKGAPSAASEATTRSSGTQNTTSESSTKTEDVVVSARLDFAAMRRALHGQVTEARFKKFRDSLFVGGDNVFHGFEIGVVLQYGNVRGSLVYYSFPNATDVDGLTRGQIAAGFAIAAPVLSGQLKR